MLPRALLFFLLFIAAYDLYAQCVFKETQLKIDFGGTGMRTPENETDHYGRVRSSCPIDGYYSYAAFTSDCFNGDWHTLTEDHTPGDADGNMLLVNGAPEPGIFFQTTLEGFKPNTTYEFGMWIMNLCRISDQCSFVLLPNITIRLQTLDGTIFAKFNTGEIARVGAPQWAHHRAVFTMPAINSIVLCMINNSPGGCGNDFVMDDIEFRECVVPPPPVIVKKAPERKPPVTKKPVPKPVVVSKEPTLRQTTVATIDSSTVTKNTRTFFPPPPPVLTNRNNNLVKRIETPAAELHIELYDNGQIDGDTVSIYHNNTLIKSKARLSDKPISFTITVNASEPYHELIMVADNLGEIPPNTSVMIITAGSARYEVFISSTEQQNAKVVIELKK